MRDKPPMSIFPSHPHWNQAPHLWLEVGPGRGDFLFAMAAQHPEITFVAIEVRHMRFSKLVRQVQEKKLGNIVLIHGMAQEAMPQLFLANSLERIYILFPDPWPKRSQSHNRLWNSDFFKLCGDLLKPDGKLFLATDVASYATEAKKSIEKTAQNWKELSTPVDFFETTYARKWKKLGRELILSFFTRGG